MLVATWLAAILFLLADPHMALDVVFLIVGFVLGYSFGRPFTISAPTRWTTDAVNFIRSPCIHSMRMTASIIIVALLIAPAHSQSADDSLRSYAIHIDRTRMEPLNGYGVYLGNGFVITAAHVVGGGDATKPQVKIDGGYLPTKVVKDGNVDDVDLTLLSVDVHKLPDSVASLHVSLCQKPYGTGEPVIVATPEGVARSYIMSPSLLPHDIPEKFRTAIRYFAATGNSGAGVFHATEKCLIGIISRRISGMRVRTVDGEAIKEHVDIAKYFVPVSEIAKFIPTEVRF